MVIGFIATLLVGFFAMVVIDFIATTVLLIATPTIAFYIWVGVVATHIGFITVAGNTLLSVNINWYYSHDYRCCCLLSLQFGGAPNCFVSVGSSASDSFCNTCRQLANIFNNCCDISSAILRAI